METKEITVLMWDSKDNFNKPETKRNLGGDHTFKKVLQFNTKDEFVKIWNNLKDDDKLVFACHVKCEDLSLYEDLRNTQIKDEYSIPDIHYLSSDAVKASSQYQKYHLESERILFYHSFITKIKADEITPFTKSKTTKESKNPSLPNNHLSQYSDIKYGIITALYEHEFEEVKKLIDWEEPFRTKTKAFRLGRMKDKPEIRVVAAIPAKTGMVDSAIIATQILELFKPEFLLMSGVCGGKKSLKFGDIVLASKVFTFQKGKISNLLDDKGKPIKLFDKNGKELDISQIYDKDGNQIEVQIENFEVEQESIEINPLVKDDIDDSLKPIKDKINEPYKLERQKINIHFEPMACSTMVINKNGYFEDKIKAIDRKTVAVEMESFGVARACQFANDGDTKCIIFKSVMDNMTKKTDKAKELAAYTSAQFLKYLIIDNVLMKE